MTDPGAAAVDGLLDQLLLEPDRALQQALTDSVARPGTVIVVDNVVRDGRVLDPAEGDLQARAVRDMLEMMGSHPRLDTAAIQTVGVKGWDGFALALVR